MSGGIVQLVATGAQDTWLTGKPEVSFFRSNYKRYTHYTAVTERQIIQGQPTAASISTVRFEKKGDLLSYVYFAARDKNGAHVNKLNWVNVIDKVELMIGGQVIDTQDFQYMTDIEPVTGAQSFNQRYLNNGNASVNNQSAGFLPLKFFFCKDWSVALPLVALQYHDVELRITWAANLAASATEAADGSQTYAQLQYQAWTSFVYLDQAEREFFAKNSHDLLITQVQRVPIGTNAVQELALAHPVKFLAFQSNNYATVYNTGGVGAGSSVAANMQLKVQINGVDVGESRFLPAYTDVAQYYHTQYGYAGNSTIANVAIISYCLDTSKLQPTGTLNFSRLDTYRLIVPTGLSGGLKGLTNQAVVTPFIYCVNYNVLRIQSGMGSVLYAN